MEFLAAKVDNLGLALQLERDAHGERKLQVAALESAISERVAASEADARELQIRREQVSGLTGDVAKLERRLSTSKLISYGVLGGCAILGFVVGGGSNSVTIGASAFNPAPRR